VPALVIIPTYNELESLPGVVERLRTAVPGAHILIADDSSPDGTGQWADQAAAQDPQIHVLHRPAKQGLGRAYVAGFGWGLEQHYDPLVEMDADGSHRPEQLPSLLEAVADGAHLAIGSRWVKGGRVTGWPFLRHVISRGGNLYVRIMLGLGIKDATAGFRAYSAKLLRRIDLNRIEAQGYGFQVNMSMAARDLGARIVEVPIDFPEREAGASKMSRNIVGEAMWLVTKWSFQRRFARLRDRRANRHRGQNTPKHNLGNGQAANARETD
jgi:dolichol-phosphate mannosyltransferase